MTGLNLKAGVLVLAAVATVAVTVSPASAQWRRHRDGSDLSNGQKVAVIAGGAAAGAVIGGLLGGKKGAIIGGILGGGTGTAVVVAKERSEHNGYYRDYRGGYSPYYQGGRYYSNSRYYGGGQYYPAGRYYPNYSYQAYGNRRYDRDGRWHDRDEHRGDHDGDSRWRGRDRRH